MRVILAVLATGLLAFLSTGPSNLWPLAWVMPVPLLAVAPELKPSRVALAAFAAAALGGLNLAVAYRGLPPLLVAGAIAFVAFPFSFIVTVWSRVARTAAPAVGVLAYGALAASVEYLVSLASPNGTFGSLAYSQSDVPLVIQLVSATGITGVTFVLSVCAAGLAMAWRARRNARAVRSALACAATALALTLAYGEARLLRAAPSKTVAAGLAASDGAVAGFGDSRAEVALPVVRDYARLAATLADRGARMIVLPEKIASLTPAVRAEAEEILGLVAREKRVLIVAGFDAVPAPKEASSPSAPPSEIEAAPARNIAVAFGASGQAVAEYDKRHLVPGLERGYRVGTTIRLLPAPNADVGLAICKDLDFAALGREYGRAGVGLLLVPAWDFVHDGWAHSRMAIVRGVENGFAVARAASQGRLTVSDAYGRVLAERTSGDAPGVLVTAPAPVGTGGTFYSRFGDWFPWLATIVSAVSVGFASRKGRRSPGSEAA